MIIKRLIIYSTFIWGLVYTNLSAQTNKIKITFEQAVEMVRSDNKSTKIANKEFEWAKSEQQGMNSFWYPKISIDGAYVHMSNDIEVKEPLSTFTNPVKDYIHSIDPSEQVITSMLENIGKYSLNIGLAPQNVSTVDAMITLPLFTGGKRIYASRIGKLMVDVSNINKDRVIADQQILLVEAYFGLRLVQKITETKEMTYVAMEKHFQNALKLEKEGMINKADRLFFQVNRDEAKRELDAALKDLIVAENTFRTLANIKTEGGIDPVSPLFINESLPELSYFKNQIIPKSYLVGGLEVQKEIQKNQIRIANAAYIPNIELFGKQTLYSHGLQKNLVPRSLIGLAFSWNIFDGLDREKNIRQAKINKQIIELQQEKVIDDQSLLADKFYNQTQNALDNVDALNTTIEMSKELVRIRRKSYQEGMATSTEIIDAELLLSKVRIASLLAYYQFDIGLINLLSVCGMPEEFYKYKNSGTSEDRILGNE